MTFDIHGWIEVANVPEPEMLDKMADFYEAEGKLKTRQAALILGTAVFLLVAVLVAIAVISFWGGYGAGVSSGGGEVAQRHHESPSYQRK